MPYDDIPTAGEHPGDDSDHESGTNVRAPGPPEPGRYEGESVESDEQTSSPRFRVARHKAEGTHRVRVWTESEMAPLGDDYEEVSRYESAEALADGLDDLGEAGQFVVFENRETGDVQVARADEAGGDWAEGGRYDQLMLFDSREAADEYAEERQNA